MKKIIAYHKYKNKKVLSVGICDKIKGVPDVDKLFLDIKQGNAGTILYLRPDEVILIIKLLSELILKRVINYTINLDKKTKKDY